MSSITKESVEKFNKKLQKNDFEELLKSAPKPKLKDLPKFHKKYISNVESKELIKPKLKVEKSKLSSIKLNNIEKPKLPDLKKFEIEPEVIKNINETQKPKYAPFTEVKIVPEKVVEKIVEKELPLLSEVPLMDIEEIDPWTKVVELVNKCNIAVIQKKLDFAEIYYEQIEPFYNRLDNSDKKFVFFKIKELNENIMEMRMKRVKQLLKVIILS